MKSFISHSPEETEKFAEKFAGSLQKGDVIAFNGDLGMGKTCFTRGLAKGLGFNGYVTSPTFALINEYLGGKLPLYHFDMYRVSGWNDLYSTGFFDYLDSSDGIIVLEWSENVESALPKNTIIINISLIDENTRKITITGNDKINEDTCN